MKLIAALAISATILAGQSSRAGLNAVTAVRHWSLAETTRIAIEVSGDFQYKSDRLHNPERVYYDILGARPRIDSRRIYSEEINDKLVTKVRVAETAPGVTRVVLDLTGPVEASTSQLSNPNRLIVELRLGAGRQGSGVGEKTPPTAVTGAAEKPTQIEIPEPPSTSPAKTDPPAAESPRAANRPSIVKAAAETSATTTPKTDSLPAESPKAANRAPIVKTAAEAAATTTPKSDSLQAETAKAAKHTATGNTSLIRTLGLKLGRVVIDPGHGGHDQGTESSKGLLEKDLVLDVAKRVGKLIEERMAAEVIYTRTDDTFIPLEARTAIANEAKADLFLSIHANSSPVPRIAGVETYYRSFTNSKDALDVAARENASSQKSIAELEDVIHTMMLGEKVGESKEFAGRMQASLFTFSARNFPGIKDRGVKKAPFVVLNGAKAPSVLVEIGFLSNAREEALLRKPEYRQKLAEAVFRGLSRYAESLSHFQVAKAGAE